MAVGVVGLGIMGSAMAGNLIAAGYDVVGYDVKPGRRRDHRRAGGTPASSVAGVSSRADIILCSLPSSEALLAVSAELASSSRHRIVSKRAPCRSPSKTRRVDALGRRKRCCSIVR